MIITKTSYETTYFVSAMAIIDVNIVNFSELLVVTTLKNSNTDNTPTNSFGEYGRKLIVH